MPRYRVIVTRSAYENVTYEVKISDRDAAEDYVLAHMSTLKPVESDIAPDEESVWEVLDSEEVSDE